MIYYDVMYDDLWCNVTYYDLMSSSEGDLDFYDFDAFKVSGISEKHTAKSIRTRPCQRTTANSNLK
jgi:hypothetical protein